MRHQAEFTVRAGDKVPFVLTWFPSFHKEPPPEIDAIRAVGRTTAWWNDWSSQSTYDGDWHDAVQRSLITLKALTYAPTGGIVAAPTTSLPEWLGGVRNWDYRYCWLRDATFTLYSLMRRGLRERSRGVARLAAARGRRRPRAPADHVRRGRRAPPRPSTSSTGSPATRGSAPGARRQRRAASSSSSTSTARCSTRCTRRRRMGITEDPDAWALQLAILDFLGGGLARARRGHLGGARAAPRLHPLEGHGVGRVRPRREGGRGVRARGARRPVEGLSRRDPQRGVRAGLRRRAQHLHAVLRLDRARRQHADDPAGRLPPADDPRVVGTVDAIQRELLVDGFVLRYPSEDGVDGLPPGEGAFLPCSFWLADNLALIGRHDDGVALFERLLGLRNDVGLLAEEYDPTSKRHARQLPAGVHPRLAGEHRVQPLDDREPGAPRGGRGDTEDAQQDQDAEDPARRDGSRALAQPVARIAPASKRPTGPGTSVNSTRASPAIVRVPSAIAVQWKS